MKYLIDTHILIWFVEGNDRLDESVRSLIAYPVVVPADRDRTKYAFCHPRRRAYCRYRCRLPNFEVAFC